MAAAVEDGGDPPDTLTFDIERGSFTIPHALFEDGREDDLARAWAVGFPLGDRVTGYATERQPDGILVRWRRVTIVPHWRRP